MSDIVIKCEEPIFSIAVHPTRPQYVTGTISGEIISYSIISNTDTPIVYSPKRKYSCRSLTFSIDGKYLYSAFKNNLITCYSSNSGDVISKTKAVFKSPVSVICAMITVLICGHDDGSLSVYSIDTLTAISQIDGGEYNDYITGINMITSHYNGNYILYTTGGGLLAMLNVDTVKIIKQAYERAELNCVLSYEEESTCIVGDSQGKLHFYSYNTNDLIKISSLKCCIDGSIECIVRISDDLICVGCSDGITRIVNRCTVRLVGTVGQKQKYDIDKLIVSQMTGKLLVNSGSVIIIYDVESILEQVMKIQSTKRKSSLISSNIDSFCLQNPNKKAKSNPVNSVEINNRISGSDSADNNESLRNECSSLVVHIDKKKNKYKHPLNSNKIKSQRANFFQYLT